MLAVEGCIGTKNGEKGTTSALKRQRSLIDGEKSGLGTDIAGGEKSIRRKSTLIIVLKRLRRIIEGQKSGFAKEKEAKPKLEHCKPP